MPFSCTQYHGAEDLQTTKSCTLTLGKSEVEQFSNAVRTLSRVSGDHTYQNRPIVTRMRARCQVSAHYWYQMYLDDLPIWGMVGEVRALALLICPRWSPSHRLVSRVSKVFKGKEQAAQTDKVKRHPLANKRGA